MSSLISAGYLPCMTIAKRNTSIEYKQFVSLNENAIEFVDTELQSSSSNYISEDEEDLKQRRCPKQTTYINAATIVSTYVANIKGI